MPRQPKPAAGGLTRRAFSGAVALGASAAAAPARALVSMSPGETIIGSGEHTYRVNHHFARLPDRFTWQTTHNVAVDSAGNLYVIHEGRKELKDHPAIFVFDREGAFVRAFGSQFQGGGHGIEVRKEGNEEFLYVCAYQQVKAFAKLTLDGETVWYRKAPMESGFYAAGEDVSTTPTWTRQGFLPTNVAFLDDGGFLLADGYGTFKIHRYDKDARWVSAFGGAGPGEGTFDTAHGLWIDRRPGREPTIVVTDRAHDTLQVFTMEGVYKETLRGFGLPANVDSRGDVLLVPELKARLTILGPDNTPVAHLGDGSARHAEVENLRSKPEQWADGQFVHPHDACFTPEGHIYVAEWVATGRVSRLEKA